MPRQDLIQYRRGTAVSWASANPVLAPGEVGYDTTNNEVRVGDGISPWVELESIVGTPGAPGADGSDATVVVYANAAALNNVITSEVGRLDVANMRTAFPTIPTTIIGDGAASVLVTTAVQDFSGLSAYDMVTQSFPISNAGYGPGFAMRTGYVTDGAGPVVWQNPWAVYSLQVPYVGASVRVVTTGFGEFYNSQEIASGVTGGAVPVRDVNGQLPVPSTPTASSHAASKAYVDALPGVFDHTAISSIGFGDGTWNQGVVRLNSPTQNPQVVQFTDTGADAPHVGMWTYFDMPLTQAVSLTVSGSGVTLNGGTSTISIPAGSAWGFRTQVTAVNTWRVDIFWKASAALAPAGTLVQRDPSGRYQATYPGVNDDVATKLYVDNNAVRYLTSYAGLDADFSTSHWGRVNTDDASTKFGLSLGDYTYGTYLYENHQGWDVADKRYQLQIVHVVDPATGGVTKVKRTRNRPNGSPWGAWSAWTLA